MSFLNQLLPALLLAPLVACAASSELSEGQPLSDLEASNALVARAVTLFKAGRFPDCVEICELLLQERRAVRKTETLRFLAAEARYQQGQFEAAFHGYRRLLDDFPFTRAHGVIPERLFVIGSALAEQPRPILGGVLHDRKPAILALGFLVVNYPEHRQADPGWLILADQHFQAGQYDLTEQAYRRLLARSPETGIREQALSRLAACLFRKTRGAAYDTEPMVAAWQVANEYLAEFSDGAFETEILELVVNVEREVRESELKIAEFYRKQGNQQGARLHALKALAVLPATARP